MGIWARCFSFILGSFLSITLLGCALLAPQPSAQSSLRPQIRDVPFSARLGSDEALRQRLLVLPFVGPSGAQDQGLAADAQRQMVFQLERSGQFIIVRPEELRFDWASYRQPDGGYDLVGLSRSASQSGIAAVLEARVMDVRSRRMSQPVGLVRQLRVKVEAEVQVRLYAARNGRELLNEVYSSDIEASITRVAQYADTDRQVTDDPQLSRQAVRQAFSLGLGPLSAAVQKLSWEGRVAMISGERVFINAGRQSGLDVGDILKITEEGPEVFDPDSGLFIGRAPGRIKGTVEVISYFGQDGSIAVVHSGSGFRENDRVELY